MEIGLGPKLSISLGEDREVVGERGGQSRGSQLVSGPLCQQNLVSSYELIMCDHKLWRRVPPYTEVWPQLPGADPSLTGEGHGPPQDCPLFRNQLSVPRSPDHPHFWPIGYTFRGSQHPLLFINSSKQPNTVLLWQMDSNWKAEVWEGPSLWASLSHPSGNRSCHPTSTSMCHDTRSMANQEIAPKIGNPEFLLGIHYVCITKWTTGYVIDLVFRSPLWKSDWKRVTHKHNLLIPRLVFLVWRAPILSHLLA